MDALTLSRALLSDPAAVQLIRLLDAELTARYPEEGATHFRLDAEEVAPGRGAFLIAWRGGIAVGCGAVRLVEAGGDTAELKRMFTRTEERGRGTASAVLHALEGIAREIGARRLVLETAIRQPEALALYERRGYARIPAFGDYLASPLSICMEKAIGG